MSAFGLILFGFGFLLFYAAKHNQGMWDELKTALGREGTTP